MDVFESMADHGHEQVVFFNHSETGLKAIVAIHNTYLGPALGGLRMWPYASESDALTDVLRLSRGMTYKAAVSGLNLGGGKAVLIGDPKKDKSEALFRALGRFIGSLGGRYITAEDVGTTVEDMEYLFQETDRVVGVHPVHGGSGDPSPFTAFGTVQGIKACLNKRFGSSSIDGKSFAVQGAGSVGGNVIRMLTKEGAKVFTCDINDDRVTEMVQEHGAEAVPLEEIYDVDANVFVPCALGSVINEDTLPRLRCEIVAGSANNQLQSEEIGTELERKGIVYAPDYAINAGGLINVAMELQGYNRERAYQAVSAIYNNVENIFNIAARDGIPTWQAADRMAEERIRAIARIRMPYSKRFKDRLSGRTPKPSHH
ncbi:MAG: leucine dehydrogenase [Gammaproteobacteria bacterium]|nr:leucine dehydrogenase [Gammaproteobacteria bacterium]NNF61621.1 Glu/Leu/Phe/Val dehydrogenase [Gammaproteobacteria bacterium]NNM21117.1 Glu/Leu/Phe/Val dehydrogenase [Gammaproteobacteria bacterium]